MRLPADRQGAVFRPTSIVIALAASALCSCLTPTEQRADADKVAYDIVGRAQEEMLGYTEDFNIVPPSESLRRRLLLDQGLPFSDKASLGSADVEPIEQWPDAEYFDREGPAPLWSSADTLAISLFDALQIGARNSREYQLQKELVFEAALVLDLERNLFDQTWFGMMSGAYDRDKLANPSTTNASGSSDLGVTKKLQNGALLGANVAWDVVKLLTQDEGSVWGLLADATVAIPLLRGSGEFVVTEPMKQAERNVVYSLFELERFKRTFAVTIATEYYSVLQLVEEVDNELENYRWLIEATRRARRMFEAQRLDGTQMDQTQQDELKARDAWIKAIRAYEGRLDLLKQFLGLPVDARIELDREEYERLVSATAFAVPEDAVENVHADAEVAVRLPTREEGGPYEIDPANAVLLALNNRLDLRVAVGRVFDSQRLVAVAADGLRADLTLLGNVTFGDRRSSGDVGMQDGRLRSDEVRYNMSAMLGLPLERTFERNVFRQSEIQFETMVRGLQMLEDQIKFEVREDLRIMLESRERLVIQVQQLELALRRVETTSRLLQVGRAEARDVLDAQSDLIDSRNQVSLERVRYRLAELSLQSDLELLEVGTDGLWTEVDPETLEPRSVGP
jgi:outer membrane protein TolC